MKFEYEEQAFRNEPMPDGLTAVDAVTYTFLRNLYWSFKKGIISKDQAQAEKDKTLRNLKELEAKKDFEIRCWENSARRTLSANHAMMMYRTNKTIENADHLVKMLEWLDDECEVPVEVKDGQTYCPICHRLFNADHASRKPTFCEDCGCRLGWEAGHEID